MSTILAGAPAMCSHLPIENKSEGLEGLYFLKYAAEKDPQTIGELIENKK
jgi:hypothetical protein